ncbi:MAG: terpene cyclase/mutase family protein [Planctomycetaceae bacterium]|nr:terpene cyclase/mutase family protein [Planctomycetaceae bacterium]
MRIADIIHFLRQIFFPQGHDRNRQCPNQTPEKENEENNKKPIYVWFEVVAKKLRSKESIGTAVSVFIHILLIWLLSWWMLPKIDKWYGIDLLVGWNPPDVKTNDISIMPGKEEPAEEEKEALKEQTQDSQPNPQHDETVEKNQPEPNALPDQANNTQSLPATDLPSPVSGGGTPERRKGDLVSGGGYEGRTPQGRGQSVGVGDSSVRGENAVEAALQWIAAHQRKDGGWNFEFEETCRQCSHGGEHGSRVAATALALLPFLGAGYTHQVDSPYKKLVDNGLFFLIKRSVEEQRGLALNREGSQGMYSQGIAAIVLCEAYAMSLQKQAKLSHAAQESLRFIENAQDRQGGGWRYRPNESPGDLSVSAWQIMALKSGKLAGLYVSQPAIYLANDFLESTATDGGRQYNYLPDLKLRGTGPDSPKTCTATGLLLRMYLGWEPGDTMLDEGITMVAQWGPFAKKDGSSCNLYYAYYATLAIHHYDNNYWQRWNSELREFLIQTQSNRGHEAGSWYFPDHYCDTGGRLLNTVLAALILETPYRIMPLFRKPKPQ